MSIHYCCINSLLFFCFFFLIWAQLGEAVKNVHWPNQMSLQKLFWSIRITFSLFAENFQQIPIIIPLRYYKFYQIQNSQLGLKPFFPDPSLYFFLFSLYELHLCHCMELNCKPQGFQSTALTIELLTQEVFLWGIYLPDIIFLTQVVLFFSHPTILKTSIIFFSVIGIKY